MCDQYLLVLQISNTSHRTSDSQCRLYRTFQHRIDIHETWENVNNYKKCRKENKVYGMLNALLEQRIHTSMCDLEAHWEERWRWSFKWFRVQNTALFWTTASAHVQLVGLHTMHPTTIFFRVKLLSGPCCSNINHLIESAVVLLSDPRSVSYQTHLARKIR